MGTWSSEQHTEPRVAVPYSWQSKNQVAAHSEVSPAWTDTSRGEAGSLHACTAKVEKQEDGEEAGGHDSGEIQVNNIKPDLPWRYADGVEDRHSSPCSFLTYT